MNVVFLMGSVAFLVMGIGGAIVFGRAGNFIPAVALGVGFPIAAVTFFFVARKVGATTRMVNALARQAIELARPPEIADPVAGVATVVSFAETGSRLKDGASVALVLDFVLDVAIEGRPPIRVEGVRLAYPEVRLGMLRPGEQFPVRVERTDPRRLAFDFDAHRVGPESSRST